MSTSTPAADAAIPAHLTGANRDAAQRQVDWQTRVRETEVAMATENAASGPNEHALAVLKVTSEHKLPNGRFALFDGPPRFRELIDGYRVKAFAGEPLPPTAQAELYASLGLAPPAAPSQPEVATPPPPGEGSPEDRLAERLIAGELLHPTELSPEAVGNYRIDLPAGYGLDANHLELLQRCADAQIPQEMVDRYIAVLTKE